MNRTELAGALFDSCPDGVLLVDADGIIRLANPVAGAMFGITDDELVDSSIDALVPPEFRDAHPRRRADYTAHPTTRPMGTGLELFAQHTSGVMFPVESASARARSTTWTTRWPPSETSATVRNRPRRWRCCKTANTSPATCTTW